MTRKSLQTKRVTEAASRSGANLEDFVDRHGDAIIAGTEVEQDWTGEATTVKFSDGSALRFCGAGRAIIADQE